MGIDIDSFLSKMEVGEKEKSLAKESEEKIVKKVNQNFDEPVESNLKEIQDTFKESNLEQLKEIYNDLKKFDENIPSKLLNIQNIGSSTTNTLSNQYSTKLLSILENNMTILSSKISKNNVLIEEDILTKEYKVCIKLIKENKDFLKQFPDEFSNEKHKLKITLRKQEIRINQEIKEFRANESKLVRKKIFDEIKVIRRVIEENDSEKIQYSLDKISSILLEIPLIFRSVFVEENIVILKTIANGEAKMLEIENKKFQQKEKGIKVVHEKFQNSVIKKDLDSALLLYNEVLILFEELPNTNFKKKVSYFDVILKLHSQLNNLYIKNNVEMLLSGYNNSKVIEEARNYIDHIEITKKISFENVSLIYKKLQKLPESTHVEQESMIKKYQLLLQKIKVTSSEKERFDSELPKEKEINKSNVKEKEEITPKTSFLKENHVKIDKNVAKEIEVLYGDLKKSTNKKEKVIIFKKIMFYLDLINLPQERKKIMITKIKKTYAGE